jgi:hypothetical protein
MIAIEDIWLTYAFAFIQLAVISYLMYFSAKRSRN